MLLTCGSAKRRNIAFLGIVPSISALRTQNPLRFGYLPELHI